MGSSNDSGFGAVPSTRCYGCGKPVTIENLREVDERIAGSVIQEEIGGYFTRCSGDGYFHSSDVDARGVLVNICLDCFRAFAVGALHVIGVE
ncbi:MAG: hypothetical protein ACTSUE_00040 [Promethearchaeota archaeon]